MQVNLIICMQKLQISVLIRVVHGQNGRKTVHLTDARVQASAE